MIQENKESRSAPRQSNTFKMLQEVLEADEKGSKHWPHKKSAQKRIIQASFSLHVSKWTLIKSPVSVLSSLCFGNCWGK